MCVLEQAYQAAWHKKSRAAAPLRQPLAPMRSARTIRRLQIFSAPYRPLRAVVRLAIGKMFPAGRKDQARHEPACAHFRQRYGYVNTHIAEQLRQQPQEAHRKKQTAHESHRSGRRSHMQRREEARQSHVQAAEQKRQLEPVDELQRHRHHFLLTGQEDLQQHFRIQREHTIQHEPDTEDHAQGKPEELAGAGEVPGPEIGSLPKETGSH